MNQPSKEAIKNMLEYFMRVSVPRILAEREAEKEKAKKGAAS